MTPEERAEAIAVIMGDLSHSRRARLRLCADEIRAAEAQARAEAARATCHELMDDLVAAQAERDRYKMWWELSQENGGEIMRENRINADNRRRAVLAAWRWRKRAQFLRACVTAVLEASPSMLFTEHWRYTHNMSMPMMRALRNLDAALHPQKESE